MTSISSVPSSSSSSHGSEGRKNQAPKKSAPKLETSPVTKNTGKGTSVPTDNLKTEKVSDLFNNSCTEDNPFAAKQAGTDEQTDTAKANDMSDFKLTKAEIVHFNPKDTIIEDWLDLI